MSTTENEEVPSSETPAESETAETEAAEAETEAASAPAQGTGEVEVAPPSDGEEDESLDIEVETEGADDDEPLDPMAELEAKLAEAEQGKKDNYDRFVRATADLENVRKRSRREVKDGRLDERGKILKDMLPVIDNLERAVEHAEQTAAEETKSIVEGVQMVLRQFHQSLERHNVKALDAVGKPFDPAVHEAVSQAPSEEYPAGTVISVLQTGYMMDDRLLRPALAVVSIAMPEAAADEDSKESEDESKDETDKAVDDEAAIDEAEAEPEGQE